MVLDFDEARECETVKYPADIADWHGDLTAGGLICLCQDG